MKGKELRQLMKARMAEEYEQDPDLRQGQKLTGGLLLVWVASRAFHLAMELICARIGFIDSHSINYLIIAIVLLFAWGIYHGSRNLAYLPILGGVSMLWTCYQGKIFSLLRTDLYAEFRLYLLAYLSAAVLQLLTMILLLTLPSCRYYSRVYLQIMKECSGQREEHHL